MLAWAIASPITLFDHRFYPHGTHYYITIRIPFMYHISFESLEGFYLQSHKLIFSVSSHLAHVQPQN